MDIEKKTSLRRAVFAWTLLILLTNVPQTFAHKPDADGSEDFFEMPVEELMDIEITTASKKEERLFETPAAVYVITSEDIRRSGAKSIPDVLRMVPGLHVARINANKWAISSRGFNHEFADKMLVMIDGRSVYTPNFGGVRWDTHDVMFEDIERIEVIRGPGGTLWGAKAINGIINIIMKDAKDTQGGLLSGGGGSEEQGFGAARYGDKIDENTYFRVYSKYFNRGDGTQFNGGSGKDGWDMFRGGFRIDSYPTDRDQWTLLGDVYDGDIGQTGTLYSLTDPISTPYTHQNTVSGGDILARWKRTYSDNSDMILQLYYNRAKRLEEVFSETLNTYDVDFQHRFPLNDGHEITWGLGYRLDRHIVNGTFNYSQNPSQDDLNLYSGFVQDRIPLVADILELILGSKFLYHYHSGFEFQPGQIVMDAG